MRKALLLAACVVATLAWAVGEDLHRPPTETALLNRLNGTPMAWHMADGGASGNYGTGRQCLAVDKGDVLRLDISSGIYICLGQESYWDAGCSIDPAVTDVNDGFRGPENSIQYLVVPETPDVSGKVAVFGGDAGQQRLLCSISDDGGTQATKIFRMR